jgi:ElaB/YqjD/DUF883 family membrane-anchored ribosome-binding protein
MTTQTGPESRGRRTMNGGTGGETTARTSGGTSQTRSTGTQAGGDRLQEAATGLADQAARTAEAQASSVMTKTGETLGQVARAIRDAGNGLREERPEIAGFTDTAAQRVEEASTYLRDHDAREVIDATQDYARRQPVVIVAGALALGLLAGRFLRSGQQPQMGSDGNWAGTTSSAGITPSRTSKKQTGR